MRDTTLPLTQKWMISVSHSTHFASECVFRLPFLSRYHPCPFRSLSFLPSSPLSTLLFHFSTPLPTSSSPSPSLPFPCPSLFFSPSPPFLLPSSIAEQDDFGWKLIHTDVFRFPAWKALLSSILGGNSTQHCITVPHTILLHSVRVTGAFPLLSTSRGWITVSVALAVYSAFGYIGTF